MFWFCLGWCFRICSFRFVRGAGELRSASGLFCCVGCFACGVLLGWWIACFVVLGFVIYVFGCCNFVIVVVWWLLDVGHWLGGL